MTVSINKHRQSVFSLSVVILIIALTDCSTNIDRLGATSVTDHRVSAASNFTDQTIPQKNITSNQSSDIKDIRKLTSEEVQLLKIMGQEFSRTTTESVCCFRHLPSGYFSAYLRIETYS